MSRISEVIKNKNRIEKSHRARRKEELSNLRGKAAYKAAISDELKYIDTLLSSDEIEGVVIKVPDKQIAKFSESIYSEELAGYEITQMPNEPDKFLIRLKAI